MPQPGTDPFHWRAFNVMLRLLGIGATFSGVIAFVTVGLGLPPMGDGPPLRNTAGLLSGGFLGLLGLGFLMLKPFRPDLGDVGAPLSPLRTVQGRRRWWTGDRVG
ncbi:MAG: hypothetical protein IPI38_08300 [Gemmatimonadetes bacterium]|nr:hypothetical protein [Gemmatimonadota bacterium]MBP9198513.1 hypothetical protein [Gemmatimonadales bacterium]MBK6782078.1 hypothetical protein [Gemmatimonadota bacterium]MBK7351813.1 hypothetical protein [Gemmatimonadota bacterium]MBK7715411.1 hypothetical protein [Gemmatimonadota bacterium]